MNEVGASDFNGKSSMVTFSTNIGGSRILGSDCDELVSTEALQIDVVKVDEVITDHSSVSLIKIDVVGHETSALHGITSILKESKPIVIFEQNREEIKNGSSECLEFLKEFEYEFYTSQFTFWLGESSVFKLLSYVVHSIVGEKIRFARTDHFQSRFHDMIIAVPHQE